MGCCSLEWVRNPKHGPNSARGRRRDEASHGDEVVIEREVWITQDGEREEERERETMISGV